ncbi:MAG TPA: RnfH family protein [Gammaproteobacteria bacterium]|jgi:hypothetical protein|nr:RnfH family protein [Gammaproteobacteria bacterium]MDP6733751.1 RnfH family protein [Gammaproteobacteria bacterium]HAJ75605.1 RnfH family protein [Gammaproteobacteria bacterium]|tara:strand:- start:1069 stop:1404 length:336 start_codon:yes stop_codon:yes gene_type:complete
MSIDPEDSAETLPVEVAYGTPEKQLIIELEVPVGTTAYEAVLLSKIADEFATIDPGNDPMGIFSRLLDGKTRAVPEEYILQAGDRVEIYRPLLIDPKEARVKREKKPKSDK